ncbi:MAG: hypothetical protein N3D11_13605 [Candidatus Sumerlaeia bacterium]|nr:hypothetical protein [Candidatus Sumerlaeia bacterium]
MSNEAAEKTKWTGWTAWTVLFLCLMLAPFVVPTAQRIAAGLRYPFEMDGEEGFVLWQARQLRQGRTIFRPLDRPPYVAATYGPLYPLINAPFAGGTVPTLFWGRLICAGSLAAVCLLMAAMVWRETRQWPAALLGPLLFLNSYDVYQWAAFYRVDFPALALGMAGLWLLGSRPPVSNVRFRCACACFVAMVYTRQVEVAPFVAAWIYYLRADRRAAWRLLRNVAGCGLGIAIVLTVLTRGQFLVHNVYYNANPFSWWQFKTVVFGRELDDGRFMRGHFLLFHEWILCALGAVLLGLLAERRKEKNSPPMESENGQTNSNHPSCDSRWLYGLYAVIAFVGILGVGKIGAATNYLIEPKAASALFLAVVLGQWLRDGGRGARTVARTLPFGAAILFLFAHTATFLAASLLYEPLHRYLAAAGRDASAPTPSRHVRLQRWLAQLPPVLLAPSNRNPSAADVLNTERLVEMLRATDGPVLCEHAVLAMRAGKDVYMQPFIMKELAREGKWDQTGVVEALRQREFGRIVTTEDICKDQFFFHYTDEMVAAIREGYRLSETLTGHGNQPALFTYYVYEPK